MQTEKNLGGRYPTNQMFSQKAIVYFDALRHQLLTE